MANLADARGANTKAVQPVELIAVIQGQHLYHCFLEQDGNMTLFERGYSKETDQMAGCWGCEIFKVDGRHSAKLIDHR